MKIKPSWKICLATAIGFLLGVVLTHVPAAKAQGNTRTTTFYKLNMNDSGKYQVGTVVGFSCVLGPERVGKLGRETECYMITQ